MGFKHSVWPPFFFHAAPKLERRSETAGLGPSAIFVASVGLLGAGPVASWCGIVCVKFQCSGGRLLWGLSIRFGPRFFSRCPKIGEEVGNGRARNLCNFCCNRGTAWCCLMLALWRAGVRFGTLERMAW